MRATGVEAKNWVGPSNDTLMPSIGQPKDSQAVKPVLEPTDDARLVHTQDTSVALTCCADVAPKTAQHAERLSELVVKWMTLDEVTREAILTLAGLRK